MKLFLRVNPDIKETEVEIRCRVGANDKGDTERIYVSQILYIEAVDRDVFAYKTEGVYRIRKTLYELEDDLKKKFFVRISKSVIVNIKAVKSVSPEDFRRYKLLLKNGEYLIVSRSYANDFKTAIGMKGGNSK